VPERFDTSWHRRAAGFSTQEIASTLVAVTVLVASLWLAWASTRSGNMPLRSSNVALRFVVAAPVAAAAVYLLPEQRQVLIALAAGVVAVCVVEVVPLAGAVAALVFLAVIGPHVRVVGFAIVLAFTGSAVGYLTSRHDAPSKAAFIATAVGVACGLLVRSTGEARRLRQRTREERARSRASENQARWLEQRTGLARELHDVVGHHVTAMVVQAEAGQVGDPRAALQAIGALGRTALGELDALVIHLRDPRSQLMMSAPPRLSDIDELLAAPLRHQGVAVVVDVDPEPGLDEFGVLTVYRIAQEALTNVARHAQARNASVEVRRVAEHVRLRITDDGVGPPDQPDRGAGLLGINERVAARGGVWELAPRLGGGTIVDVLIPAARTGAL